MNIAFDIDGTVADWEGYVRDVLIPLTRSKGLKVVDRKTDKTEKMFGLTKEQDIELWEEINEHYISTVEAKHGASDTLRELHKEHQLFGLTNRGYEWYDLDKMYEQSTFERTVTTEWLCNNEFEFDGLIFNKCGTVKSELIKALGINIIFEDSPEQIRAILKDCKDTEVILVENEYNICLLNEFPELLHFENWQNEAPSVISEAIRRVKDKRVRD